MGSMMEKFFRLGDDILTEDASIIYNGPDPDSIAIVELLNKAIKEEFDAVDLYNNIAMNAEQMGITDVVNLLNHINTEENSHIGLLQDVLKKFTENAYAIDEGREEASKFLTEGVHKIYVNGELKDEIESDNPIEDVDKKAYEYKKMNGVKEVRIVYADGSTNNMKVESLTESASFKEGDIFDYSGLYGGQYNCEVKRVENDKLYVDVSWVSEDTGETIHDETVFDIVQDSQGNDCIVVWEYDADTKGYVYPPSLELAEESNNVQYGVHQFSTDSIIFRGTEEECGKYIDDNKELWDDAEVYTMTPDDPHYQKIEEDIEHVPNYNREIAAHLSTAYKAAREALDRYMKTGIISDVKAYSFIALSNIERAHELMNEGQSEELTEGNPVSNQLPPVIDQFLQDLAQQYGYFTYNDIIKHKFTDSEIKSLRYYRKKYNDLCEEFPDPDDDENYKVDSVVEKVADIISKKNESISEGKELTESSEMNKFIDGIEEDEGRTVIDSEILREEPITSGDNRAWLLKFDLDNNETRYYVVSGFYWEIELETTDKQEAEDYFDGLVYNEEQEDY